jgi:uncharacterized DUF497 family protein
MKITFDPAKWEWTVRERGLDFRDAPKVFAGLRFTFEDTRFDYPNSATSRSDCSTVEW